VGLLEEIIGEGVKEGEKGSEEEVFDEEELREFLK